MFPKYSGTLTSYALSVGISIDSLFRLSSLREFLDYLSIDARSSISTELYLFSPVKILFLLEKRRFFTIFWTSFCISSFFRWMSEYLDELSPLVLL